MKQFLENYMTEADRTTGPDFHADLVQPVTLLDAIAGVRAVSPQIDAIKKALFYGKQTDDLAFSLRIADKDSYGEVSTDLIQAVLGIYTEAAELLEILETLLNNRHNPLSYEEEGQVAKDLTNEAGDVMWYQALLFKYLGTDFEKVGEKNIAKLRKRFPVKFEKDLAVNRNEATENVVFE